MPQRPLGIMASFSNVVFKKDGNEVFSTNVTSGGCFGPDEDLIVINRAYARLKEAVQKGEAPAAAKDFNSVAVRNHEYAVDLKPSAKIAKGDLKPLTP